MNLIEKATIMHYHRHRIKRYARGTVEALGYRGTESQKKRFDALAEAGNPEGCSVLDLGCGHGDLKGYLDERFHGFSYIGIDQMPEFVEEARSLYGQRQNCYFCLADFTAAELPESDFVFASGALAYRSSDPRFHFAMIEKMYIAAKKVFVFNMLDSSKFPDHELLTGHDPEKVLDFCRTLSPQVGLVSGYLDDDFTILMHRICVGGINGKDEQGRN